MLLLGAFLNALRCHVLVLCWRKTLKSSDNLIIGALPDSAELTVGTMMNFDLPFYSNDLCLRERQDKSLLNIVKDIYCRTSYECHNASYMCSVACYFGGDDVKNIADPAKKIHVICRWIPICTTKHVWGRLIERPYQLVASTECTEYAGYMTRLDRYCTSYGSRVPKIVFHSQPSADFYSDIPSVEDIFVFLRYKHQNYIVVGRNTCTIFGKNVF